jgi:hypothetical protein
MESDLNMLNLYIIPHDILEGVWEKAKEDAFASVVTEFATALAWRADPDPTTKHSEVTKVGFGVVAAFIFTWKGVLYTQMVVKSIGPEMRIKSGAGQRGTKGVANSLMGTFEGPILMQAIGSSGMDVIAKLGKENTDFWVLVEFPTLVKIDILIGNARGVTEEPLMEPVQRCTFRDARCAILESGGMIGKKNVASLAVDTLVLCLTMSLVLGMLASKCEIDRDALPGDRCQAGRVVTRCTLGKLGREADRTLFADGSTPWENLGVPSMCSWAW